jgi:hypothetical protein
MSDDTDTGRAASPVPRQVRVVTPLTRIPDEFPSVTIEFEKEVSTGLGAAFSDQ